MPNPVNSPCNRWVKDILESLYEKYTLEVNEQRRMGIRARLYEQPLQDIAAELATLLPRDMADYYEPREDGAAWIATYISQQWATARPNFVAEIVDPPLQWVAFDVGAADLVRSLMDNKIELLEHQKIWTRYCLSADYSDDFFYGVEVETEHTAKYGFDLAYWRKEIDGSLRNDGLEFISDPFKFSQLDRTVTELYAALDTMLPKHKLLTFPFRTSIHVHANVKHLNSCQVINLMLLYALFEDSFFTVAGAQRYSSNFCVPLKQVNIFFKKKGHGAYTLLPQLLQHWGKYSAFNMLPISQQGTVEFRHHPGTMNKHKVTTWVTLIHKLLVAASKTTDPPSKYSEYLIRIPSKDALSFTESIFEEITEPILENFDINDFRDSQLSLRGF